jgi:hypothetical protein
MSIETLPFIAANLGLHLGSVETKTQPMMSVPLSPIT